MKLERGDVGDYLEETEGEWRMNMNLFHCICVENAQNAFFNGSLRLGEQCNQKSRGRGVRKTKVPVN